MAISNALQCKIAFLLKVLHGTTPHIKNMTDLEQLVGKLNAHVEKEECLMMWTPYADREFNRKILHN